MKQKQSVAVIGAGALGAWTAWHLAKAGCHVTLIEMEAPGHIRASSGGDTRVIRGVYGEGGHYTAMVPEAMTSWLELQQRANQRLFHDTGVLWLHGLDSSYLDASKRHMAQSGLPLEALTEEQLKARYPNLTCGGIEGAFFEQQAGVLMARKACQVLVKACRHEGVDYVQARAVPGASHNNLLQSLNLDLGHQFKADAFVFACGPWLKRMFPQWLGDFLVTSRQEVCFFKTPSGRSRLEWQRFPVWIEFGDAIYYGLPDVDGGGLKVALDERGGPIDPDMDERVVAKETIARVREFLAKRFPSLASEPLIAGKVCQYTNTPDGELLMDQHPEYDNVWLLGGGSGHAFKLAPVMARLLAARILENTSTNPAWGLAHRLKDKPSRTQFQDT